MNTFVLASFGVRHSQSDTPSKIEIANTYRAERATDSSHKTGRNEVCRPVLRYASMDERSLDMT